MVEIKICEKKQQKPGSQSKNKKLSNNCAVDTKVLQCCVGIGGRKYFLKVFFRKP